MLLPVLLVAAPLLAKADMYNLLEPHKLPGPNCPRGCAPWSSANDTVHSWWSGGAPPPDAASHCAQLPKAPGLLNPTPELDPEGLGSVGSWCLCEGGGWDYCISPQYIPEQVNVQIAAPDTVVISFVTFEPSFPANLPEILVGSSDKDLKPPPNDTIAVTHQYTSPSHLRVYYMHFIVLKALRAKTDYYYKVRSGSSRAVWSDLFVFRSGYSGGVTRVAIFGDMGVYQWNNMANMLQDAEDGTIDLVVHMGDHCYNIGGFDDRRGDGYMNAYQPVISRVPWLPIVGNHEFYDGDHLRRYLNQTEGTVVANPPNHPLVEGGHSTADSALGSILSRGNHHGMGSLGTVPSGTSRWYSVDFGLVHFIALDLNMYNAVDVCGETCREAQLRWLEQDLQQANTNRDKVPWIIAMSHFPLYCSNCPAPGHDPGEWWNAEECEYEGHDSSCNPSSSSSTTLPPPPLPLPWWKLSQQDVVPDFEPLFMKYGVDVYSSGHIHDYEFIYPVYNNTLVQKSFENPRAPVHLVTGNGGPPSASYFNGTAPWSAINGSNYSYTRLTAFNSSHMLWSQVANNGSSILVEQWITQETHGAFPSPSLA